MSSCQIDTAALAGKKVAGIYSLERLLGSGSFGAVYEGLDTSTKKKVAVKLEQIGKNVPKMLIEEARVMKQLSDGGDEVKF